MENFPRIIFVHYHEVGLKGNNRSFFEKKLQDNVANVLKINSVSCLKTKRISGRICFIVDDAVCLSNSEILGIVRAVPGVARVSLAYECEQNLDDMIRAGVFVMREAGGNNIASFKLSSRRNHTNFIKNSMELNQIVGGALSDAYPMVKVQMKDPELTVHLEVIENSAYVYGQSISGVAGLPVGCSGHLVGLLSSGIDSPVAIWKMAVRGAEVEAIHFSGAPIVASDSEYLVQDIAEEFSKAGIMNKVHIVRIGKYQKFIAQDCPSKLRIILYRRFMYKIAEELARRNSCGALITGESLGQVASQTLENLSVTDASVKLPVLRPLVGSNKQDIIDIAQKINTFDISAQNAPDCCTLYMPKNPETHARLKYVEYAEEKYDYESWIEEALSEERIFSCS